MPAPPINRDHWRESQHVDESIGDTATLQSPWRLPMHVRAAICLRGGQTRSRNATLPISGRVTFSAITAVGACTIRNTTLFLLRGTVLNKTGQRVYGNWPASIRKPKSPRKTNRARCLSLVPGTNEAQTTTYCPFFAASRCHSITFWKMPLPPDSITSPWHGMILSKSHPLIFAMLLL